MKLFATFGYDESDTRAVLIKDPSPDRAAHVTFVKDALASGSSTHPILRIVDIKGGAIKKRRITRKPETTETVTEVAGGAPIETPKRKRGRPRKNPEPQLS